LLVSTTVPVAVLAWDDCPLNETDCSYPGDCNRYIDTDNDKICDHSQPAPEDRIEEISSAEVVKENINNPINNKRNKMVYHLVPISLILIIIYLFTHILSKKKIISVVYHRKIWNILLLISFLISGILGILLIIEINFGAKFSLPFNILFWHVEVGIAMFAISMFHIFWHWAYFKNVLRVRK